VHSIHDVTFRADDDGILQVRSENPFGVVANIVPERRVTQRLTLKVLVRPIEAVQWNLFNGHCFSQCPQGTRFPVVGEFLVTIYKTMFSEFGCHFQTSL
jgi:hypothetical protein